MEARRFSCSLPVPLRCHRSDGNVVDAQTALGEAAPWEMLRAKGSWSAPWEGKRMPRGANNLHGCKNAKLGGLWVSFLSPLLCICSYLEAVPGCLCSASPGVFLALSLAAALHGMNLREALQPLRPCGAGVVHLDSIKSMACSSPDGDVRWEGNYGWTKE